MWGMRSIAVGVETEAQRRFLLEAGCELMQGHHFQAPLAASRVPSLFRDRETGWAAEAAPEPGSA